MAADEIRVADGLNADRVAIVLPPRERFDPAEAGAIGLLARRLAGSSLVIGAAEGGFPDVRYARARPAGVSPRASLRYAAGVARVLRSDASYGPSRPALIEVHNRPDVALALRHALPAIRVVLFLHNDPLRMRGLAKPARRRRLAARLTRIVTVSEYLRGRFLENVDAPLPVEVLPNCIDLAAIPPSPQERAREILFCGRVVADKGADAFVAACAHALPRLPGWRGEMLGADRFGAVSPETPFLRALRPRAAAAGVRMRGYVPHEEVLAAMARAAIVVVPSRWAEPFGLTALEAMACGAALACSARGGLPEVVGDVAVPIDPDDPAGIAAVLVALAGDPARRTALGEAGRTRARPFDAGKARTRLDAMRERWLAAPAAPISWPRRWRPA